MQPVLVAQLEGGEEEGGRACSPGNTGAGRFLPGRGHWLEGLLATGLSVARPLWIYRNEAAFV